MSQILNHCISFLNRFDVYAASRNIDDPSLAKISPTIPEDRYLKQNFIKKNTDSSTKPQVQCFIIKLYTGKKTFSVSSEAVTCFFGPGRTVGDIPTKMEVLCRVKLLWSCSVH